MYRFLNAGGMPYDPEEPFPHRTVRNPAGLAAGPGGVFRLRRQRAGRRGHRVPAKRPGPDPGRCRRHRVLAGPAVGQQDGGGGGQRPLPRVRQPAHGLPAARHRLHPGRLRPDGDRGGHQGSISQRYAAGRAGLHDSGCDRRRPQRRTGPRRGRTRSNSSSGPHGGAGRRDRRGLPRRSAGPASGRAGGVRRRPGPAGAGAGDLARSLARAAPAGAGR